MSQDLICDLFVSDQVVAPCSPFHGVHERKADEHSIRLLDSGARLVSSVLWVEVEFLGVFQGQAGCHLERRHQGWCEVYHVLHHHGPRGGDLGAACDTSGKICKIDGQPSNHVCVDIVVSAPMIFVRAHHTFE